MTTSADHRARAVALMRAIVGARPPVLPIYSDASGTIVDERWELAEQFVDECTLAAKLSIEEARAKSG